MSTNIQLLSSIIVLSIKHKKTRDNIKELNVTHNNASFLSIISKPPKIYLCHISQRKAWYLDILRSWKCWRFVWKITETETIDCFTNYLLISFLLIDWTTHWLIVSVVIYWPNRFKSSLPNIDIGCLVTDCFI